jgi:hypothetical protein
MSDEDGTENNSTGGGLRKQLEDALATIKAQNDRLDKFETVEKAKTVAQVLTAKGMDEARALKTAALYRGDASQDAVGKWADEYADVFGVKAVDDQSQQQAGQQQIVDPNVLAAQRVTGAAFGSQSVTQNDPANGKALGNPEELLALITGPTRLPYKELQRLGIMPPDNAFLAGQHEA